MLGLASKDTSPPSKAKTSQPKKFTLSPDAHLPSSDALRKLKDMRKSLCSETHTVVTERKSEVSKSSSPPAPPRRREELLDSLYRSNIPSDNDEAVLRKLISAIAARKELSTDYTPDFVDLLLARLTRYCRSSVSQYISYETYRAIINEVDNLVLPPSFPASTVISSTSAPLFDSRESRAPTTLLSPPKPRSEPLAQPQPVPTPSVMPKAAAPPRREPSEECMARSPRESERDDESSVYSEESMDMEPISVSRSVQTETTKRPIRRSTAAQTASEETRPSREKKPSVSIPKSPRQQTQRFHQTLSDDDIYDDEHFPTVHVQDMRSDYKENDSQNSSDTFEDVHPVIDVDIHGQWRRPQRRAWSDVDVNKSVNLSGLTFDVSF